MKKYFFAVDVGGTYIKSAIVSDNKILFKESLPTKLLNSTPLELIIKSLFEKLELASNFKVNESSGIAIASAGLIDQKNGIIKFSGNLNLKNYPIVEKLKTIYSAPIKIANDADIATLAELNLGGGKTLDNFLFLTIGTGIGGGIVLNKKVLGLELPYSTEIGHIKISEKPTQCSCGETGCYEALASTKALVENFKTKLKNSPNSPVLKKYDIDSVTGKTIFEFLGKDETADQALEEFIHYLGSGIVNLVNIFCTDVVFIGGAISAQWTHIGKKLNDYVNSHIFVKNIGKKIEIKQAKDLGDAGLLGGIFLFD